MFNLTAEYREKKLRSEIDQFVYFNAGTDVKQFAKNPALISALFLDALSPSQALQIVLRSEVSHVIQNSFEPIEDKLDFIKRLDKDYMNFYETHFLILKEPELSELFVFQRTGAKEEMIKIIFDFLKVDRFSPRHFNTVSVLSELIMNAKAVSESHKEIADTGVIKIVVEKTKNLIAFSVFDYAGSLSFNKFLKKIESTTELGYRESINFGRGGAGIGTSIIYNNAESIYLSCKQGVVSRVSAVVPFNKKESDLEQMQKSIHVIRNLVKVKGSLYV